MKKVAIKMDVAFFIFALAILKSPLAAIAWF
jgi:hypothetical protein